MTNWEALGQLSVVCVGRGGIVAKKGPPPVYDAKKVFSRKLKIPQVATRAGSAMEPL